MVSANLVLVIMVVLTEINGRGDAAMKSYIRANRMFEDARFVLTEICAVKEGESVVFLVDEPSYANARVFAEIAKELGACPILIDLDLYHDERGFMPVPRIEPLRQAMLHADVVFLVINQKQTNIGRLLGNRDETDKSLLKSSRRYTLEANGMERWHLEKDRVLRDRQRTEALYEKMLKAHTARVTSARGTDFTCEVGDAPDGMYPVMGIIPFYGEVAVVPAMGTVNGVFVADGGSEYAYHHRGYPIRPNIEGNREIWRDPLRMTYKGSILTRYEGDPVQVARLDKLMREVDPKPDLCDELGIVTCTSPENNLFGWLVDGSHQSGCLHTAIGNNHRRGEIIHSTEHVDFDMHDPVLYVDDVKILENGVWNDEWILKN